LGSVPGQGGFTAVRQTIRLLPIFSWDASIPHAISLPPDLPELLGRKKIANLQVTWHATIFPNIEVSKRVVYLKSEIFSISRWR
jgi:hypothetical protein